MDIKELEVEAVEVLKKDGKVLLAHEVELCFEPAIALALDAIKEAIPGKIDDAVIDMLSPILVKELKAQLDKLVAGI